MSSRNIIKSDLMKLLPDLEESDLPPELIALAETFITQARQLFMNTSEQPAKNFVCSHIACDQMSTKLGLPELNIKQAPILPAKYKALFKRIRSEATFKQVKDSGKSHAETRRRIARDHAQEICSKFSAVPIANVLEILDRLVESYKTTDVRALVAATYLLCLQHTKHTKNISSSVQTQLMRDLGLTKAEIETEVEYVQGKSAGKDWFEFSKVKKLDLEGQAPKKKQRITQTRMMHHAIDFDNAKYQADFQEWKTDMVRRLDERIKVLTST